MTWINTTITTEKGPQNIFINLDNVKYFKQKDDGRALVVFTNGSTSLIDDLYSKVIREAAPWSTT